MSDISISISRKAATNTFLHVEDMHKTSLQFAGQQLKKGLF